MTKIGKLEVTYFFGFIVLIVLYFGLPGTNGGLKQVPEYLKSSSSKNLSPSDSKFPNYFDDFENPRNIFMFWNTGYESVKPDNKICRRTWEKLNPTWTLKFLTNDDLLVLVDEENLKIINSVPNLANRADMIRLYMLNHYGGVWADADVCGILPLDSWLPEHIGKDGKEFFVTRLSPYFDRSVASWFLAAKKNSVIGVKWYESLVKHVQVHHKFVHYFEMHYHFDSLVKSDPEFRAAEALMSPKVYAAWPDDKPPLRPGFTTTPVGGDPLLVEAIIAPGTKVAVPKIDLPCAIVSPKHSKRYSGEAEQFQQLVDLEILPLVKLNGHQRLPVHLMDVLCQRVFSTTFKEALKLYT